MKEIILIIIGLGIGKFVDCVFALSDEIDEGVNRKTSIVAILLLGSILVLTLTVLLKDPSSYD